MKAMPALIPVVFLMEWWKAIVGFALGAGLVSILEALK